MILSLLSSVSFLMTNKGENYNEEDQVYCYFLSSVVTFCAWTSSALGEQTTGNAVTPPEHAKTW